MAWYWHVVIYWHSTNTIYLDGGVELTDPRYAEKSVCFWCTQIEFTDKKNRLCFDLLIIYVYSNIYSCCLQFSFKANRCTQKIDKHWLDLSAAWLWLFVKVEVIIVNGFLYVSALVWFRALWCDKQHFIPRNKQQEKKTTAYLTLIGKLNIIFEDINKILLRFDKLMM